MPHPKAQTLTVEQIAEAQRLRLMPSGKFRFLGWRPISKIMGVSEKAWLRHFDPEQAERDSKRRQRDRADLRKLKIKLPDSNSMTAPPAHVLAERDRMLSYPRNAIAELMGDPPFGRSALERKTRTSTDAHGG